MSWRHLVGPQTLLAVLTGLVSVVSNLIAWPKVELDAKQAERVEAVAQSVHKNPEKARRPFIPLLQTSVTALGSIKCSDRTPSPPQPAPPPPSPPQLAPSSPSLPQPAPPLQIA